MNVQTDISSLAVTDNEANGFGPEVTTFSPASQTIIAADEFLMPGEAL